ncbi:hypothetical protein KAU55_03930 [Candidatus Bathyarchaeota archaeon]|nr:hypothetical protein [Candidatus Bathyarchaeota archaeon]
MRKPKLASLPVLVLTAAIMILINAIMIAGIGEPIILQSYPVSSVDILMDPNQDPWARIAFGIPMFVEGVLAYLWIIIALLNLLVAIKLYLNPGNPATLSFLTVIFSFISIVFGGGFIIGFVLGIIGGVMGLQSRTSPGESFLGKLIRAAKLDRKLFTTLKESSKGLREALITIMFISFLSGLGCSIYISNANAITNSNAESISRILLLGETAIDFSMIGTAINFVGIAVFKWILLSSIIYVIGSKLWALSSELDTIAKTVAFAYAPVALQVFLPFLLGNAQLVSGLWPTLMFYVTNLWMIIALIVAVKLSFGLTNSQAAGLTILAGSVYWITIYKVMIPLITIISTNYYGQKFTFPGLWFDINPMEIVFLLASCSVLIAYALGVFKKH